MKGEMYENYHWKEIKITQFGGRKWQLQNHRKRLSVLVKKKNSVSLPLSITLARAHTHKNKKHQIKMADQLIQCSYTLVRWQKSPVFSLAEMWL